MPGRIEWFWGGFFLFMGSIILAQHLRGRALSLLDGSQKAQVVDAFARHGALRLLVMVVLLGITVMTTRHGSHAYEALFGVIILLGLWTMATQWRTLRRLNLPGPYVRTVTVAGLIPLAGMLALMGTLWWGLYGR